MSAIRASGDSLMLRPAARGTIERRFIDVPCATVAAWFLPLATGGLLYAVNRAVCLMPGAERYAESWFRLNAIARARPCGVLLVSELAERAYLLVDHTHALL
jgi:hypothetical protein